MSSHCQEEQANTGEDGQGEKPGMGGVGGVADGRRVADTWAVWPAVTCWLALDAVFMLTANDCRAITGGYNEAGLDNISIPRQERNDRCSAWPGERR
jgi:hypothetical protein